MAVTHRMLAVLALGSAIAARPAAAQTEGSVSRTHTVSVTVPPRVKVQVGNVATTTQKSISPSPVAANALSVSISATQSWVLSVGEAANSQDLEWSVDGGRSFVELYSKGATVASGRFSQVPAESTLVFRGASAPGGADRQSAEDAVALENAVVLTVVAP